MRISIFPENGEWLLVLNHREPKHNAPEADELHVASSFEKCWSGEGWSDSPADGKRFRSKIEAATYLNTNWERMENEAAAFRNPIALSALIRG